MKPLTRFLDAQDNSNNFEYIDMEVDNRHIDFFLPREFNDPELLHAIIQDLLTLKSRYCFLLDSNICDIQTANLLFPHLCSMQYYAECDDILPIETSYYIGTEKISQSDYLFHLRQVENEK